MPPLKILLARPTRVYYQSPISILFIISSFPSSILYGYVLSQLLSLLTRSCVIKYNTGTYQHRLCLEWCRAILATVNSNWLALSATLIILQVRESASSRCSQEWISTRLLALVANCVNALNAYLHWRITLPLPGFGILVMTCKSTCDLLLCRSRSISHKARDPKSKGRRQLLIISPVIPGVTAILVLR